jgi:hypothetical protein
MPLTLLLTLMGCESCSENSLVKVDKVQEDSGLQDLGFANNWGKWLSMSTLSNGSPAVSYYDTTAGALGYAVADLESSPTEWTHENVDGYTNDQGLDQGDRGKYSSIAIASDDRVWIGYYDIGLKNLRYATKDPETGEWKTGLADAGGGGSPDAGWFASISLDGDEQPVIAHYDSSRTDLRVARWNGSAFTTEVVDEGADGTDESGDAVDPDAGQFPSIAIDGGTEYIAYYDVANKELKLASGGEGDWSIETVDTEGDVGQWPDLHVADGMLYIAYHDVQNQSLKYAKGRPGDWSIQTVDDAEMVGADSDLVLHDGVASIVYFDGRFNDMKMARESGGSWTIDTVTGADGALGFHNELVRIGGRSYAACYNYTEGKVWFSLVD